MSFDLKTETHGTEVMIRLGGELDASVADEFKRAVEQAAASSPRRLVLFMDELQFLASAGLRILIFAKQKMGAGVDIYVIGAKGPVLSTLQMSGFHHAVYLKDSYVG